MEGREKGVVMGSGAERVTGSILLTLRARGQGHWLELPEGVLFSWRLDLQAALSKVGPGEEIWKTCILEESGFPGEPSLTLKGGIKYNSRSRKQTVEMKRGAKIYSATIHG